MKPSTSRIYKTAFNERGKLHLLLAAAFLLTPLNGLSITKAMKLQGYVIRNHEGRTNNEFRFSFDSIFQGNKSRIETHWNNGEQLIFGSDGTDSYSLNRMATTRAQHPESVQFATVSSCRFPIMSYTAVQAVWITSSLAYNSNTLTECQNLTLRSTGRPHTLQQSFLSATQWTSTHPPLPKQIQWHTPPPASPNPSNATPYKRGPILAAELKLSAFRSISGWSIPTAATLNTYRPLNLPQSATFNQLEGNRIVAILGRSATQDETSRALISYINTHPDQLRDVIERVAPVETHLVVVTNLFFTNGPTTYKPTITARISVRDFRFIDKIKKPLDYTIYDKQWISSDHPGLRARIQSLQPTLNAPPPGGRNLVALRILLILTSFGAALGFVFWTKITINGKKPYERKKN